MRNLRSQPCDLAQGQRVREATWLRPIETISTRKVEGLGLIGFRVSGIGFRGLGFRVSGFGFRGSEFRR